MKRPEAFFVISRYNEDYSWVKDYTSRYLVYNKGEPINSDVHVCNVENIGANQRDIFNFIVAMYYDLPSVIAFLQANPFDHCSRKAFDRYIYNTTFTPLESYGQYPANGWEQRSADGGFIEINNSWYIAAHNATHKITCRYSSFDEFMNKYFENYRHLDWIRFTPGSQYIVEKERILHYPINFWMHLMNELDQKTNTEGHIIERSLWHIFQNYLMVRKEYC